MIKSFILFFILTSSVLVNAGNGSGTMSYGDISLNELSGIGGGGGGVRPDKTNPELMLAGGGGGGGVFENPVLVKYLSEKASEIKFSTAIKENGTWTTNVHSLRPEEFSINNQNILEAISASKIQNGNWIKSN